MLSPEQDALLSGLSQKGLHVCLLLLHLVQEGLFVAVLELSLGVELLGHFADHLVFEGQHLFVVSVLGGLVTLQSVQSDSHGLVLSLESLVVRLDTLQFLVVLLLDGLDGGHGVSQCLLDLLVLLVQEGVDLFGLLDVSLSDGLADGE